MSCTSEYQLDPENPSPRQGRGFDESSYDRTNYRSPDGSEDDETDGELLVIGIPLTQIELVSAVAGQILKLFKSLKT